MKKIIISIISILVGVTIAITIVFLFYDKKSEVYIESSYNDVRMSFGKTKVEEINNTGSSRYDKCRVYTLSDPYEFYENNIETSAYYNSKLSFYDDNENVYGYLIKDGVAENKKDFYKWQVFDYNQSLSYDNIVELYKCMNQDMVKIEDDVIYLKGYDYSKILTNDYILKIVNVDDYGYGYEVAK